MTLWVRFRANDGRVGFGVLHGSEISDGSEIVEHHGDMFGTAHAAGGRLAAGQYSLLSPCEPGKIVGLWNNFHALAAKIGKAAPSENADFPQWVRAKSFDTFGCLGPCIATSLDWAASSVVVRLDGVERQNYPLSDMIFSAEELVSRISHDLTLLPGDVIACGTSLGAGSIKPGASVEVSITGVGTLINRLLPGGG